ncbi:hypothetical protein GQ53DRAFT_729933 [Thozetella sp. PMI_491]|nr:hypothetical protein GQ53DRAFT_729933 [Thozetella sp. PMI_491]
MVPPVEEAVLKNNPEFENLYRTLTTVILNPDGSTKNEHRGKERNAVREELRKHRLKTAKQHLLTHAISTAAPADSKPAAPRRTRAPARPGASPELPEPLLDLLLLLPPFLKEAKALPPDATALLLTSAPFSDLPELLPKLTPLIASSLHASAVPLARIASPSTNPSYIHRAIPSVPTHISTLGAAIAAHKAELSKARISAATSLVSLLAEHTAALTHLIRALEAKHGVVARALELRADEVSLAAQRQAVEAESTLWAVRRDIYTPEVRGALQNYQGHLRDAKLRLAESIRTLQGELGAYGVGGGGRDGEEADGGGRGKERTMREMARVYRDMGRQIEETKRDLDRLGMA